MKYRLKQFEQLKFAVQNCETQLNTYFDDPAGGFATTIYQGGTTAPSPVSLSNGQKLELDFRADANAFKDIIRGLSVIALAPETADSFASDDFSTIFSSGIGVLSNGKTGVTEFEAELGIVSETISRIDEHNEMERLTLTAAYSALTTRDQFEAAGELKRLEVQLESSYLITSRLSNLTLVNFLR